MPRAKEKPVSKGNPSGNAIREFQLLRVAVGPWLQKRSFQSFLLLNSYRPQRSILPERLCWLFALSPFDEHFKACSSNRNSYSQCHLRVGDPAKEKDRFLEIILSITLELFPQLSIHPFSSFKASITCPATTSTFFRTSSSPGARSDKQTAQRLFLTILFLKSYHRARVNFWREGGASSCVLAEPVKTMAIVFHNVSQYLDDEQYLDIV